MNKELYDRAHDLAYRLEANSGDAERAIMEVLHWVYTQGLQDSLEAAARAAEEQARKTPGLRAEMELMSTALRAAVVSSRKLQERGYEPEKETVN